MGPPTHFTPFLADPDPSLVEMESSSVLYRQDYDDDQVDLMEVSLDVRRRHGLSLVSRCCMVSLATITATSTLLALLFVSLYAVDHSELTATKIRLADLPDEQALSKLREGLATPKNIIFMISDGFGPASETAARTWEAYQAGRLYDLNFRTPLDEILVGTVRTLAASNLVTDSAGAATAYACGKKSYNAAIGVTPDIKSCGTILEAAKLKGYRTGLVTNTRVTHATPAAFAAHVGFRDDEDLIADFFLGNYQLGGMVDVALGGGLSFFAPNTSSISKRRDGRDLVREAQDKGYTVVLNKQELQNLPSSRGSSILPILGLFSPGYMPYEIDRSDSDLSLLDMATYTLDLLNNATSQDEANGAGKAKGFFAMIEGGRIDHAGHNNDPATHVREVEMYHKTIAVVKKWVDAHPGTLLISTSDHETGGLTVARQLNLSSYDTPYYWNPEVLTPIKKSSEFITAELRKAFNNAVGSAKGLSVVDVREIVETYVVTDPKPTNEEIQKIYEALQSGQDTLVNWAVGSISSTRSLLGWTTHGHSGVDVNLYAYGTGSKHLHGNLDNTDIPQWIANVWDLNLQEITNRLSRGFPQPSPPASKQKRSLSHVLHD